MAFDDISDFLGDIAYEIALAIIVAVVMILFMRFYSRIRFVITRLRLRNKVDLEVWTTIALKEPTIAEEALENIKRDISRIRKAPVDDAVIDFWGVGYSFISSDSEQKVMVIRTITILENIEIRRIKDELQRYDYTTRKLVSGMDALGTIRNAEISMTLDRTPDSDVAGMRISSVVLTDGGDGDELRLRLDGNKVVFNTDFNPRDLDAVLDFVTYLYTPK